MLSEYLKSLFGGLIPADLTPVKMMGREWKIIIGKVEEQEVERLQQRELIQTILDALHQHVKYPGNRNGACMCGLHVGHTSFCKTTQAIEKAKEQGFTPTT